MQMSILPFKESKTFKNSKFSNIQNIQNFQKKIGICKTSVLLVYITTEPMADAIQHISLISHKGNRKLHLSQYIKHEIENF